MGTEIYLVRWRDGSFSFLFDQSQETLFLALDPIGEPSDAEVRIMPPGLISGVFFDQEKDLGLFTISVDIEHTLWQKCTKQIWPLESLGS
jgi:hypothetical protein